MRQGLRREHVLVAAIVLLALALRVVHVLSMRASPFFDEPAMDPLYHVEWARAVAAGREHQPGPFFRAPLYPWFLAGIFRVLGDGLLAPRIVQALLGAATTLLAYLVGKRAFDARAGIVAALLVATNWVLVYFDGELLIETLAVPLYMLGIWLALGLAERASARGALLAGAVFGLSALVRPNVLLVMPVLFAWLIWRARPAWRTGLAPALALTAGTLLPILPVSAYNAIVGGERVLISTQGGVNFWIGNNPESDGSSAIVPGTRAGWWDGYHDAIAQAEALEGRPLAAAEVSRHYSRRAWRWILDSPRDSLAHLAWKLRLFWSDAELGNNADERFFAHRFSPLIRFLPPSFALLAPLGALGLLASLRRGGGRRVPLAAFLVLYSLSIVAFFVCSRFRVPILPALAVYAGYALVGGFELLRARRLALLGGLSALALLGVLSVRAVPAAVDQSGSAGHWMLGVHELQRGRPAAAVAHLEQAVERNPRSWLARKDLGLCLMELGRLEEAAPHLEVARVRSREDVVVLATLAELHLRAGRAEEALPIARRMAELRPDMAVGPYDEGRAHRLAGRVEAARAALLRALEVEPEHFHAALALGLLELEQGRAAAAAALLARAARSPAADPRWLLGAYEGLLRAQLAMGDRPAAEAVLDEARRRMPHEPRLAILERLLTP